MRTATTPTSSAVTRPSQAAGGIPTFAVLANNPVGRAPGQTSYLVELVAPDGHVAATQVASLPSIMPRGLIAPTPLVSSSDTRLYFLNGDSEVRFLKPDGATGVATQLPGSGQVHAAFAVSPDDRRIAVSLLDYSTQPIHLRMYVEDLAGGGNHVDIFTATNGIAEWPVGWRDGNLVVAVGPIAVQNVWPNPYNAGNAGAPGPNDAYHLVDPATGNRLAAVGSDCNFGALTLAGTGCRTATGAADLRWDGQRHGFARPDNVEPGPVSPDGSRMAGAGQQPPFPIVLLSASTSGAAGVDGNPLGWLDDGHLVFGTLSGTSYVGDAILDTVSGKKVTVDTRHQYLSFFGSLPGGLSASDHFTCRLPLGGLIDTTRGRPARDGGFITFPGVGFKVDPAADLQEGGAGGFVTVASPQLNGGDAEAYDVPQHRWLPTRPALVAPGGSSYTYSAPNGLHVVDVRSAADRLLPGTNATQRSFYPVAYTASGIFVLEGPEQISPTPVALTLWVVDPNSGQQRQVSSTATTASAIVAGGAAWITTLNPSDPHPWQQSPYEPSAANDQLLRVDLLTGVASTWFYRPGAFVGPVGFDGEGHPVVVVVNSAASELWLLRGQQTGDRIYAGPGAYSPVNRLKIDHVLAVGVTDANGIWFDVDGGGGVVLYTPGGGVELASASLTTGRIGGPCQSGS
jgi:hypothetical protein